MFRMIAVFFSATLMLGCALRAEEAPYQDVDKAAGLFFQRLDAAEYAAIYNDAADNFKTQKPADVVNILKNLAANGKVQQYNRTKMTFQEEPGRVAVPVYGVAFERAAAEITFQFIDVGGEWKLLAFVIKHRGGNPAGEATKPN